MPEYVYRAVTNKGLIVRNKVEDVNKQTLIKRLKANGLTPIRVVQVGYMSKNRKKKKKNVANVDEIMKSAGTTNIMRNDVKNNLSFIEELNLRLSATQKITNRDLVIFTQNFYLLKKANFNNIHALNTLIESTENLSLKGILEDILAGVEGRRLYVYNNGILLECISIYISGGGGGWGIIRFTNKFIKASSKIFR